MGKVDGVPEHLERATRTATIQAARMALWDAAETLARCEIILAGTRAQGARFAAADARKVRAIVERAQADLGEVL